MAVAADEVAEDAASIVDELRRRRRSQRRSTTSRLDRSFDIYTVVVAAIVILPGLLPTIGAPFSVRLHELAMARGAAFAGLLVALAAGAGMRSGSFGGPLLLSAADVAMVLLAPVNHQRALRRRNRRAAAVVLSVGGLAGGLAAAPVASTVSTQPVLVVLSAIAAGALAGAVGFGAALIAGRRHLAPAHALALAATVITWSVVDISLGVMSSPLSWVGAVAVWPITSTSFAVGGVVLALALLVVAFRVRGDVDIEKVQRRGVVMTGVLGGVALQDVRSFFLAAHARPDELPRRRPWLPPPPPKALAGWRRGWLGLLRLPVPRLIRIAALGATIGVVTVAAIDAPLLAAFAVLACYVAAMELVEPIAQEIDRPTRRASYPLRALYLYLRMLGPSVVAMTLVFLIAAGAAWAVGGSATARFLAASSVSGGVAAVTWATAAAARGKPDFDKTLRMMTDPTGASLYLYHLGPAAGSSAAVGAAILTELFPEASAVGTAVLPLVAAAVALGVLTWVTWGER